MEAKTIRGSIFIDYLKLTNMKNSINQLKTI